MLSALPLLLLAPSLADELDDARELYRTGQYQECLAATAAGIADGFDEEDWHLLRFEVLRVLGAGEDLEAAIEAAENDCPREIDWRLEAYHALRGVGRIDRAGEVLAEARSLGRRYGYRFRDAAGQTVLGRIELLYGGDEKEVLDDYFRPAKADEPEALEPRRAIAEVGLSKHDYGLAADELRAALELAPEDPDLLVLLARALAPTDGAAAHELVMRAVQLNPRHAPALLAQVDACLAGEVYADAEPLLERLLATDPGRPEAWAYRAVLAHLQGDRAREEACRDTALERWAENPDVDHLIGRELSEKYRFAEGAAAQRRALERDPDHVEARFHLAQDLLRLGEESEGWQLAEAVLADDPYHVVAYNLMLLHDVLADYATFARDGVIVRMDAEEAAVYGERVVDLLVEARDELARRYRVTLDGPLTLELFARQSDFAIRTFGLPGGEGFLGVCFGDVITMKSPLSQGEEPANWEAVLWHELCHAITLNKTRNRMPRWLSEGISVWEERRRDPSWGQSMLPAYRARILAGEAWALDRLGDAFRQPDGPFGLQFAYYESSLAVEFLVERHGFDALLDVLDQLAGSADIHAALEGHEGLGEAFEAWMRARAEAWYPDLTWDPVRFSRRDVEGLAVFVQENPGNVVARNRLADALIEAGLHEEARAHLKRSLELCPDLLGAGCAYELLAASYRETGEPEARLEVLERWLARESGALAARLARMELRAQREEWAPALDAARGVLAVQPMLTAAHRVRADAARALGDHAEALAAGEALLALDPVDPARVHFLVAEAAHGLGDTVTARRQVLRALEEAPRFREALDLLLVLAREGGGDE